MSSDVYSSYLWPAFKPSKILIQRLDDIVVSCPGFFPGPTLFMLYLFPSVITARHTILMIPRYIYFGSQMLQINPLKQRLVLKTNLQPLNSDKSVIPVRVTESGKGAPLLSDRCIRSTFKIPFLIVLIIRVVFRDCEANLLLQARTAHTGSSIPL